MRDRHSPIKDTDDEFTRQLKLSLMAMGEDAPFIFLDEPTPEMLARSAETQKLIDEKGYQPDIDWE